MSDWGAKVNAMASKIKGKIVNMSKPIIQDFDKRIPHLIDFFSLIGRRSFSLCAIFYSQVHELVNDQPSANPHTCRMIPMVAPMEENIVAITPIYHTFRYKLNASEVLSHRFIYMGPSSKKSFDPGASLRVFFFVMHSKSRARSAWRNWNRNDNSASTARTRQNIEKFHGGAVVSQDRVWWEATL